MSKWSGVAVVVAVLAFAAGIRAQAAPEHHPPVVPTATARPPLPAAKKPQRPTCASPAVYDLRLGRCVKREVIPTATDQVPEGHREETITVLRSRWDQMGADLKQAADRIRQLKKQTAELHQQVDDLKKKPGCGG